MGRGIVDRVKHEVREIGLVTLYFLTCFLFFLLLKRLLLAQYEIEVSVVGTAVVGALVVAKVVVVLDATRFGDRFRGGPRLLHIAYRSLVYTAVVFVVTVAERLFELYREHDGMEAALSAAWASRDVHHFFAMNLTIGVSFLVYHAFSELNAELGEGGLRRFLLKR